MTVETLDKDVSPNTSTILAVDRTRLAHDRTLMAWVRTSASLISFGFTIYKFFQYLHEQQGTQSRGGFGPRQFGPHPVSLGGGIKCWAHSGPGGPANCGIRIVVTPLFPR